MLKYGIGVGIAVAIAGMAFIGVPPTLVAHADETEPEEEIDYETLENPVPFTKASIGRGRVIFKRMCTECHGPDGKGQMDVIADASDLTSPKRYYNGTLVGEVYRSIREGAGTNMPAYLDQVPKEEDLWHLVNFVLSLWPDDMQPELVEEPQEGDKGATDEGE